VDEKRHWTERLDFWITQKNMQVKQLTWQKKNKVATIVIAAILTISIYYLWKTIKSTKK
jgi:hypothetical protein